MTSSPLKFRNILGELTVSKLYRGEHLGVTAPANFDLRAEISKIGKTLSKFYEPAVTQNWAVLKRKG
ncbi:MAG: hypothetical protein DCF19_22695 [Pseudanabaena frigida]|uniref:Uncharacterized protein n=1 Tax=Pseudanabaena frigida TaxID=945775 RepID=A0A2W4XXE1_9CYAN|nr:MAG: hypothetical protein DCF19_22695 [Pseudanabaena frigida]